MEALGQSRRQIARTCVRALVDARRVGRRGIIIIDGRSGSGKSQLARWLSNDIAREVPIVLLAMDSWYPGWDGLDAGSQILSRDVLGEASSYPAWDWREGCVLTQVPVDPHAPLLIEGCGALTLDTREHADYAMWIDAEESIRKQRALSRDGEAYAPHWQMWAAQEEAHIARNCPQELADLCLDTSRIEA